MRLNDRSPLSKQDAFAKFRGSDREPNRTKMRHLYDPRTTSFVTPPPRPPRPPVPPRPLVPVERSADVDADVVDLDIDIDVDVDIHSDDGIMPALPLPATDAVRARAQSWSSVPVISQSPACPVKDRRRTYRHEVKLAIELGLAGKKHLAETRLLSLGGAFIASPLDPAYNTRLQLRFTLPRQNLTIEVGGLVRWGDARGFGVQFDGLRAHAVWSLGRFFRGL